MSAMFLIAAVLASILAMSTSHLHDQVHDKAHMSHHLQGITDINQMSEEELRFNYFKAHDIEGNNKLDGCEMVQALLHYHSEQEHGYGGPGKVFSDKELEMLIDPILFHDDKNLDGFIDYPEYVKAQERFGH